MLSQRANEQPEDWGRVVLRPPLIVAGILAAAMATSHAKRAARRVVEAGDRGPHAIARFRAALLGKSPRLVRRVLGEPSARSATCWYFPLDANEKLLLAVEFQAARVHDASLVRLRALTNPA